jgi:hypothetical protein
VYGAWDNPESMVPLPESSYDGGDDADEAGVGGYQSAPIKRVKKKPENACDGCDGDDEYDFGGYQSAPSKAVQKKTRRAHKRLSSGGPMTRSKTINLKKKAE